MGLVQLSVRGKKAINAPLTPSYCIKCAVRSQRTDSVVPFQWLFNVANQHGWERRKWKKDRQKIKLRGEGKERWTKSNEFRSVMHTVGQSWQCPFCKVTPHHAEGAADTDCLLLISLSWEQGASSITIKKTFPQDQLNRQRQLLQCGTKKHAKHTVYCRPNKQRQAWVGRYETQRKCTQNCVCVYFSGLKHPFIYWFIFVCIT